MDNNKDFFANFNLGNARILLYSICDFEKQTDFEPFYHCHPYHEIFFVKQGEGIIKIDREKYKLYENSFIVVPASTDHYILWQSEDARINAMIFEFYKNTKPNNKIKSDIYELLNRLISRDNKPYTFKESSEIIDKFEMLLNTLKNPNKLLYEEYINHTSVLFAIDIIYVLIKEQNCLCPVVKNFSDLLVIGKSADLFGDTISDVVKKLSYISIIEKYVRDLSHTKVTLSELAVKFGLSNRQTIRLTKQIYNNMSFLELFMITRINIAKSLIIDTDLSFESIAEKIGYSYRGFLSAFKKVTGITPSEFKKL